MNFIAILCIILKSVIYGSSVFFTGYLTENVHIADILALRFLLSFIVIWLIKVFKITKINVGIKDLFKKNDRTPYMREMIAAGIFEPVLYMVFETFGISMTTGITTAVIIALSPITNCIAENIILKERNSLLEKALLGAGIIGVIYIAVKSDSSGGENSAAGILFLFAAVFCGSAFSAFSRKSSSHFAAMEITYASCMLGTLAFNLFNIVRHIFEGNIANYFLPFANSDNLIGFLFLSVLSTIAATAMNNFALGKLQISTTAAFGGVSTLTTILIGVIFKNEVLYYYHFIGLTLIFIRMIGISYIASKRTMKN